MFVLSSYRTFTRIDNVLKFKTNFNLFKIIEIHIIFSGHDRIKLETNNRKLTGKSLYS
jgi:hypothetical protein